MSGCWACVVAWHHTLVSTTCPFSSATCTLLSPLPVSPAPHRYGVLKCSQECELCTEPVLLSDFYLFPCLHAFHSRCLVNEVSLVYIVYFAAL